MLVSFEKFRIWPESLAVKKPTFGTSISSA
ncbi:unnamed protein product [Victoria cruziana]